MFDLELQVFSFQYVELCTQVLSTKKHLYTWVSLTEVVYTFFHLKDQGCSRFYVLMQYSELSFV